MPLLRSDTTRDVVELRPSLTTVQLDVPTFNEVGIKGFDVTNWYSVMGPRGLPKDVVAKIDDAVQKAMTDPSIRPKLEGQGVQFGGPKTPEAFDALLKAELAKYSKLVKELGVKAE